MLVLAGCNSDGGRESATQTLSLSTGTTTVAPAPVEQIAREELRLQPRILFVRGSLYSASGDLLSTRPDGSRMRTVHKWKNWRTTWDGEPGVLEHVSSQDGRWSPDRHSIALAQYGWTNDPYLWTSVISADGSAERIVTRPHWDGPYAAPSWSRDGNRIALVKGGRLWIVAVDSGSARKFRFRAEINEPDWSPVGGAIAVRIRDKGIALTSETGSRLEYVTHASDQSPAWSPDGQRIAFARAAGAIHPKKNSGIWLVNPDGSGLQRLTTGRDDSPRWSPDGTKILFTRSGDLYVMDADGGRQTLLPFRLPDKPELLVLGADWGR
jgi:Tol biopolymer transport system component